MELAETEITLTDRFDSLQLVEHYVVGLNVHRDEPDEKDLPQKAELSNRVSRAGRVIDPNHHELKLSIDVRVVKKYGSTIHGTLDYYGLFRCKANGFETTAPIVLAEGSYLLFPYARAIIERAIQDAGGPLIWLEFDLFADVIPIETVH